MAVLGESICPYCGVGCRLRLEGEGGRVHGVRGVEEAAANLGRLCAKGAQLGPTIQTADRLTRPQLRRARHDPFRPTDWDTALSAAATGLNGVKERHGPQSIGLLASARLTNEENYLLQKFARGVIGTNSVHSCEAT